MSPAIHLLPLLPAILLATSPLSAGEPLSRAEIVKRAKPATALVEVKPGYGSAFCVHSSGLFVTNEHVIASAGGNVNLILNAGQKTQKLLKAKVIRTDKKLDLANLQALGADKLATLPLGMDDKLLELTEVVAFGFPFGTALARPGVSLGYRQCHHTATLSATQRKSPAASRRRAFVQHNPFIRSPSLARRANGV